MNKLYFHTVSSETFWPKMLVAFLVAFWPEILRIAEWVKVDEIGCSCTEIIDPNKNPWQKVHMFLAEFTLPVN